MLLENHVSGGLPVSSFYTYNFFFSVFVPFNGFLRMDDLTFTPEMNNPAENRFQELTKKLEKGLNEEFCDGTNCHARFINFRTEKINPKKSLETVCGFPEISHTIVDFLINIEILAGQESTVKKDLDQKMTNCKVISGHQVTPGTFSRGNCNSAQLLS